MDYCSESPKDYKHCWHTGNDEQKGLYKICCWCGVREYLQPKQMPEHGKFLPVVKE